MKTIKKITFTKEGLENLEKELEELKEARPAAVKELSRARELGDLSENGLYTAAKARLRSMDGRIARVSAMIKLADVRKAPKGKVGIGSKVTVEQKGKEIIFEVVGDFEANPSERKISTRSPIGTALIGKKAGDTVTIETPAGQTELKIIKTD